jgi:hypothetical protein
MPNFSRESPMRKNVPVIWDPIRWSSSWFDLFRYPVNSRDGLPPYARAEAILGVIKQLRKYRRSPGLWVTVDAPGRWYMDELKDTLASCNQPVAISMVGQEVSISDFFKLPGSYSLKPATPDFIASVFDEFSLSPRERSKLQVLRALARVTVAGTKEIASVSGFSHTYMRKLLPELVRDRYVEHQEDGSREKTNKYPLWMIKRAGIQYVQQSWNIPDNLGFKGLRVEQKYAGQKHRKIARLWWSWLKEAYGTDYEIWQVWPEPAVGNSHPDALAWGAYQGVETLAWLEVESGKKSRDRIVQDIMARYQQAKAVANAYEMQMIFVVLAQPWVLKSLQNYALLFIPWNVSLIFENWRNVGYLSKPIFGEFNSMMKGDGYPYIKEISRIIKKDPNYLSPRMLPHLADEFFSSGPV